MTRKLFPHVALAAVVAALALGPAASRSNSHVASAASSKPGAASHPRHHVRPGAHWNQRPGPSL